MKGEVREMEERSKEEPGGEERRVKGMLKRNHRSPPLGPGSFDDRGRP